MEQKTGLRVMSISKIKSLWSIENYGSSLKRVPECGRLQRDMA